MQHRRFVLRLPLGLLATTAPLAAWPILARAQAAEATDASAFVRAAGNELAAIVAGPGTRAEKEGKVPGFIDRVVDVPAVARFCLGRYWREATPAQQQEFTRLFRAVLVRNVVVRMGDYQGSQAPAKVTVGRADQHDDGSLYVTTTLDRPPNQPVVLTWVVDGTAGHFHIDDLIVAGTSLRLTTRSDYASFLQRNGGDIDGLLAALRKQTGES